MSDESPVLQIEGGRVVSQIDTPESSLAEDERDAAKKAVREAMRAEESKAKAKARKEAKDSGKSDDEADEEAEKAARKPKTPSEEVSESRKGYEPPPKNSSKETDSKSVPSVKEKTSEKESSNPKNEGEKESDGSNKKTGNSVSEHDEELDIEKSSVKQLLKNREKVANLKRQVADEGQQLQQQLQAQQQEFQRQQWELRKQQEDFQRQQQEWLNLRNDPARAVQAAGLDPKEFIYQLAQDGTPEGQQARLNRELKERLDRMDQERRQYEQQMRYYAEQQRMQQIAQMRSQVENEFFTHANDSTKYPFASKFNQGPLKRILSAWGDITAQEFRNLTGREADFPDMLDYINDSLAEMFEAWYQERVKSAKPVPLQEEKDSDDEVKERSAGKSLSPNASSDRRSVKNKDEDLDEEERKAAARRAVKAALRANKDK